MSKPTYRDLTREKTLLQLWLTSFKFEKRAFNVLVAAVMAVLLARYCALVWSEPHTMVTFLRRVEGTGLTFATAILGFLVAGFTIFVTVTRVDMFLEMAQREKAKTGESYLKYNLSAFIVTFVHYTTYIFVCLTMELFLQPGGLASVALTNARTYPCLAELLPKALPWICASAVTVFGTWTVYLVLLLKSFIYNVYQTTTTLIAFEWAKAEEKAEQDAKRALIPESGSPLYGVGPDG